MIPGIADVPVTGADDWGDTARCIPAHENISEKTRQQVFKKYVFFPSVCWWSVSEYHSSDNIKETSGRITMASLAAEKELLGKRRARTD